MKESEKLRNRLIFKATGRWPQSVVDERLANQGLSQKWADIINGILQPYYEEAGYDYVPYRAGQRTPHDPTEPR